MGSSLFFFVAVGEARVIQFRTTTILGNAQSVIPAGLPGTLVDAIKLKTFLRLKNRSKFALET